MNFQKKLLGWFKENRRSFPWRENAEQYNVWLSEIILQQTRAAQGLPYYESFISNFPKVEQLAAAKENHILKLWQGLGYYSRARNLHATAKIIKNQYKGRFPTDFDQIKALKGVGDYTASAIASICFGQEQKHLNELLGRYTTAVNEEQKLKSSLLAYEIALQYESFHSDEQALYYYEIVVELAQNNQEELFYAFSR